MDKQTMKYAFSLWNKPDPKITFNCLKPDPRAPPTTSSWIAWLDRVQQMRPPLCRWDLYFISWNEAVRGRISLSLTERRLCFLKIIAKVKQQWSWLHRLNVKIKQWKTNFDQQALHLRHKTHYCVYLVLSSFAMCVLNRTSKNNF